MGVSQKRLEIDGGIHYMTLQNKTYQDEDFNKFERPLTHEGSLTPEKSKSSAAILRYKYEIDIHQAHMEHQQALARSRSRSPNT